MASSEQAKTWHVANDVDGIEKLVSQATALRLALEQVIEFLRHELSDSEAEVAAHVQRHHAELSQALASVSSIGAVSGRCCWPSCQSWASSAGDASPLWSA